MLSACKAAEAEIERRELSFGANVCWNFSYVIPVVVLDAQLFNAFLDQKGNLMVERVQYATVRFRYQSFHYSRYTYLVDVVTLDSLAAYPDIIEPGVSSVADALVSVRDHGLQPAEAYTMIDLSTRRPIEASSRRTKT